MNAVEAKTADDVFQATLTAAGLGFKEEGHQLVIFKTTNTLFNEGVRPRIALGAAIARRTISMRGKK